MCLAVSACAFGSPSVSGASEWLIEAGDETMSRIVSTHIQVAPLDVMSVQYKCVSTEQQLDVYLPEGMYFEMFKVDPEVGVAWESDEITKFPDGATFNGMTAWSKAAVSFPPGITSYILTFKSDDFPVLSEALSLAKSRQRVILRLFKADLKPPVDDKDILLEFTIPTKGSTKVFEKAFLDCGVENWMD